MQIQVHASLIFLITAMHTVMLLRLSKFLITLPRLSLVFYSVCTNKVIVNFSLTTLETCPNPSYEMKFNETLSNLVL